MKNFARHSPKEPKSHTVSLKGLYIQHLVNGLPAVLAELDPNGAFSPQLWGITNQDVIYSLALAHETRDPENPFFSDPAILRAASLAGDYLRRLQDESGRVEFVKVDGSRWGKIYMPWTMYHWLEAFQLLQTKLPKTRRNDWRKGLQLALHGMSNEIKATRPANISDEEHFEKNWVFRRPYEVNNISTWNGMTLVRAGQVFKNQGWTKTGTKMIHAAVEAMHPSGFWPEFGGPTTYYNLITLQAIGLYYAFTQDRTVLPCLEKGSEFQIHFTYPDGRLVETVDGRVRYDDRVQERGHAAFIPFPTGLGYLRFLHGQMARDAATADAPAPIYTVFDLPFFQRKTGSLSSASPFLLSTLPHIGDGIEFPPPQLKDSFVYRLGRLALIRKKGDWFYCLSGFTGATQESRWAMERQNHVSLWHRKVGLIVGGGNSQNQPEWSNFVLDSRYTASDGRVGHTRDLDSLFLRFDDIECRISLRFPSSTEAVMTLDVGDESARACAYSHIVLNIPEGKFIETARGEHFFFSEQPVALHSRRIGAWLRHNGWRLQITEESKLSWPSFPSNPYVPAGPSPLCTARAILQVPHASNKSIQLSFHIEK